MTVAVKNGGFEITNVQRKPELPAQALLSKNADPYKVWKLSTMKLETGADELVFSFTPAALDNPGRSPYGFGAIRLDLYMDINHRARAGMARPLDGRPLRMFPEDAWEYALEITPGRAALYTVTPRGPVKTGLYAAKAENGAVTVRVPRSALKGNPLLWGYAALLLAPKGATDMMITDYIAADVDNGYIYAVRPGADGGNK
jgi:carbohydrate-binding DOMON domain-containing protein